MTQRRISADVGKRAWRGCCGLPAVLAVLVAVSLAGPVRAGERSDREDPVVLTAKRLGGILVLSRAWRYHPGDDPAWADPSFDDSAWALVGPDLRDPGAVPGGWPGIGWFRRRVVLGADVLGTTVGVHAHQVGASEVYVDGVLAVRFGTVSADPALERPVAPQVVDSIALQPGTVHVLAVRYSNAGENVLSGGFRGFELRLGSIQAMSSWGMSLMRTYTGLTGGAIGMFGTFALLHLLLFLMQPSLRENLYFTVFNVALVAVLGTELWMNSLSGLNEIRVAFNVEMTCMLAMVVAALLLERRVFNRRLDVAFWVVVACGVATIVWLWSRPAFFDSPVLVVFMVLGLLDMLRLAAGALLKREPDAWVVAAGFAVLTLSFFGALLRNLGVLQVSPWPLFIGGMGTLVFSFSVYLTRRVARTAHELARRLDEVQELTAKTLSQERAAREQEIARRVLEADNLRKTAELEEARRLQLAMLPRDLPEVPGFDLAVHMETASEVGGDYYDFLRDPDGGWTVALGDATGHGLHAGMVVGVAKSLLRTANGAGDLGARLQRVHVGLASLNERRAGMSLLLVRLDASVLRVASAGMPPLLVWRCASGEVEEILLSGFPLGTVQEAEWHEHEVTVEKGDRLLLMSDGLAEAVGPGGEPFGYDRVERAFSAAGARDPAEAVADLLARLDDYRQGEAITDDVTLLVLRAIGTRE